jgi:hypothetical protein
VQRLAQFHNLRRDGLVGLLIHERLEADQLPAQQLHDPLEHPRFYLHMLDRRISAVRIVFGEHGTDAAADVDQLIYDESLEIGLRRQQRKLYRKAIEPLQRGQLLNQGLLRYLAFSDLAQPRIGRSLDPRMAVRCACAGIFARQEDLPWSALSCYHPRPERSRHGHLVVR